MLSQLFVVRCLTIALATLAVALAASQSARGISVPVLINGVTVEDGVAMVTGVVDAEVVEVNGVLVSVGENGAFTAPIDLSADALVLKVLESPSEVVTISIPTDVLLATGGEGVLNNLAAAGISVIAPVEGFQVIDSQMPLVEGRVLNASSLSALTVNGVNVLGRLGEDGLFSIDLGSSRSSTTRETVTVTATDRRGVSQTSTFRTSRVTSTIATRAGTSVSAAGAQGIVITRIAVDKRFLKAAKFVRLVVTVKDRRGYVIRGASLRLRAMPSKHMANGALRAGFTNRVGKARFGFRLRTSALAGPGPKFLTIATRAATPKSSATKKVTLRLPVAAVTG